MKTRLCFSRIATSLVAFLSIFTSNLAMAHVAALNSPVGTNTSSAAISIDPRVNAIINPGQTVKGNLSVTNEDNTAPLYLTLRVIDFTYTNDTGTAKLFIAKNAPQTVWSLKPYISLPSQVTIGDGRSANIPYTIKIPSNLGAGSYYSAIEYASGLGTGGYLGLSASGVTLVFVNVPGTVHEKMTVSKFGAFTETGTNEAGHFNPYITTEKPNSLAFEVKNSGNVAESPAGSIVIKKWGHTYTTIKSINPNNLLSLIGQTRLYIPCINPQTKSPNPSIAADQNTCLSSSLAPGYYTSTLTLYYGQNGNPTQEIVATTSFWYIPLWLLIIVIILLLIIIYVIWRIYKKIKPYFNSSGSHVKGGNRSYNMRANRNSRPRLRR
jgi:hypothetical protein